MARLYGKNFSKAELMRRIGDISQIAGIKIYQLTDGNQKGVDAVDFRTGTGLSFTVLVGRGMDISHAEYNGQPLCWRSATGDINSAYFEPEGLGWLRGFYAGLITTCGLTYAGAPCVDEGKELGLHGRVSYTPAKNVWADGEWDGDEYIMWVQGKIREASVFGENIILTRNIKAKLGKSKIYLHDIVENLGFEPVPHMILYHINGGFPAVDEDSLLISTSKDVKPRDDEAKIDAEHYYKFQAPTPGFKERVYYHDMLVDKEGYAYASLVNKKFNDGQGFGFYVKYLKSQLPRFIEWKMNGEGTYVVGMEPANCLVEGRDKERKNGTLQFLDPGEKREYKLEIGVLSSISEIEEFEKLVNMCKSSISV
ncbi:MAG: aldose 1-epimerase family protein [bacterium]